jgi:hypothetical protein
MAYTVPTFNLTCNVYTGPWETKVFRESIACNLRMGRSSLTLNSSGGIGITDTYGVSPVLLLPSGSDVRDNSCYNQTDIIECPAGSGRFYNVGNVDDVGKGFPNEFRIATLNKIFHLCGGDGTFVGLFWPFPIP